MKHFLIIKMWALGDIVMATPLLNAIRAAEPKARITWIVDSYHAEVLAGHPLIDELISLDSGAWRRLLRRANVPAWIRRTRELRAQMSERRFDVVINCQPDKWWSWFLCVAPLRVALYPSPTLPQSRWFYTHAITKPKKAGLHNTDHYLLATSAIGIPPSSKALSIGESLEERPFYTEFAQRHGLQVDRLTIVVAPFSTADNRSLSPKLAAGLVNRLSTEYGAQVVLTAGPSDSHKAEAVRSAVAKGTVALASGASLRQYIALLRHCDLVVTVDSSPMHLAAAVGTPYVALFGPTPAEERAPLEGRGAVVVKSLPCAPCDSPFCRNKIFQECIVRIELGEIMHAVEKVVWDYVLTGGTTRLEAGARGDSA